MQQEDVAAVYGIEQTTLSPWTPEMLRSELKISGGKQLVAVAASGKPIGWCCCRLVPPEAELLKIAVDTAVRRSGVGGLLFNILLDDLVTSQISTLFLEVRSQNSAALQFYLKNNFLQVGERPNYYTHPGDDALILQYQFIVE